MNALLGNQRPDRSRVDMAEIAQIELFILKRMKELARGDHASVFKGTGFDFVGLRDREPGDPISSVDWAASSLIHFSPLVTREFEQDSNATIFALADASGSTCCGTQGTLIRTAIARCLAAIGLSAVLSQNPFGFIAFDDRFRQVAAARPRIGKSHVNYCVDLYQHDGHATGAGMTQDNVIASIAGSLRKTSLVPVISDFLLADAEPVIQELSILNASHDVFLLMPDVRFAFEFPDISAGWVEVYDVETGRGQVFSRRQIAELTARVADWQEHLIRFASERGLEMVRVGLNPWEMENTLVEFFAERRLRKVRTA